MNNLSTILSLNLTSDAVAQTAGFVREQYQGLGHYPPKKNQTAIRHYDVESAIKMAVFRHLGFEISNSDLKEFVNPGPKVAIDYFYGAYFKQRDGSISSLPKSFGSWLEVYRAGLFLALLYDDQESIRRLTDWVEPTLPFDETSYELTEFDNSYHFLLAEYLKDGDFSSKQLLADFDKCKRKRPKMLINCLKSIEEKDTEIFSLNLQEFLQYYLKSEFDNSGYPTLFSIEGSILWHVALRAGIEPTGLSEKQTALIMTRETLGLED